MSRMEKETVQALSDSVLHQAKLFLEEADEFYPFGSVIDQNQILKPVSIYWGDEFPDVGDVLRKLQEVIKQGIETGDYITAVIAVDVLIKLDNPSAQGKSDALELRYYQGKSCTITYYAYFKKNNGYVFELVQGM